MLSAPGDAQDGRIPYDDLPDGVVVADDTGAVVIVNVAAERLLGLPADELIGKDLGSVLPLVDRNNCDWWELCDPYGGLAIRTGHPERALTLLGGREVLVSARYLRAARLGRVVRVVVTLRSGAARERWDRDRAELVAMVAHELRSPLTGVKGFTSTLLNRWDRFTDAQRKEMLATVDADADKLARLITELLDIARIDSGRLELYRRPTDLAAALRRHVATRVAAGAAPQDFRIELPAPVPEMWVDADKVDQVIGNLLENAQRHGDGVTTLRLEPTANGVAITVSDQGPGVPTELVGQIFDRFWRDRRHGGTGLGLYIAKGLVEAHGGTIGVGRAPGGGAAFRFTLPEFVPEGA
ncbi:ATP-binding protein [Sporichthya brevicatena]|uniref:sensor histidine kinase n=1 Tax=Sporichthya brevicatena TaxID=171442 RepID=UPI0031E131EA